MVVAILVSDGQTVMMTLQQAASEATTASLDHETQQQLPSLDHETQQQLPIGLQGMRQCFALQQQNP